MTDAMRPERDGISQATGWLPPFFGDAVVALGVNEHSVRPPCVSGLSEKDTCPTLRPCRHGSVVPTVDRMQQGTALRARPEWKSRRAQRGRDSRRGVSRTGRRLLSRPRLCGASEGSQQTPTVAGDVGVTTCRPGRP